MPQRRFKMTSDAHRPTEARIPKHTEHTEAPRRAAPGWGEGGAGFETRATGTWRLLFLTANTSRQKKKKKRQRKKRERIKETPDLIKAPLGVLFHSFLTESPLASSFFLSLLEPWALSQRADRSVCCFSIPLVSPFTETVSLHGDGTDAHQGDGPRPFLSLIPTRVQQA